MEPIRVLIVDDHGVMRAGLQAMISAQADMAVVGCASSGDDALFLAPKARPDVIVLDVEMPGRGGLECMPLLRHACPDARVLVLTMHDDPVLVRRSFEAGASGYVVKEALGDDLLAAIRTVHHGRSYINVSMPQDGQATAASALEPAGDKLVDDRLSGRERQVLEMLAQGLTNSEIGKRLHLSPRTIGTYRGRLNEKLGLRTRADIVQFALDSGMLARD
jgi:two-component system response regulator NreC